MRIIYWLTLIVAGTLLPFGLAAAADHEQIARIAAVQSENIDRIESLAMLCNARNFSHEKKSVEISQQLVLWLPRSKQCIVTDINSNENLLADSTQCLSILELYGTLDNNLPCWTMFKQYSLTPSSHIHVSNLDGKANDFLVTVTYTAATEMPKLYVDWSMREENAYMPHLVTMREGQDSDDARIKKQMLIAYEKQDRVVVPRFIDIKKYDTTKKELMTNRKIVISRLALNKLEKDRPFDGTKLTLEMLFGDTRRWYERESKIRSETPLARKPLQFSAT